jgi:CP family cyanate transporter-like MFS transporter
MSDKGFYRCYDFFRNTPGGVLILTLLIVGLISRGPVAVFAPIAYQLEAEFQADNATIGLLSGIPVFCFAVFSPLASYLIGKKGLEWVFTASLAIIIGGILIRLFGGFDVLLLSTIVIGAGIAFGNITIPLISARDFPKNFTTVTGIYAMMSNFGNLLAAAFTVPLSQLMGWRLAIFCWMFLSLATLAVWTIYLFRKRRGKSRKAYAKAGESWRELKKLNRISGHTSLFSTSSTNQDSQINNTNSRNIYRHLFTYGICLVFIIQCFGFFSFTAWLPSIFSAQGMDPSLAGLSSAIFPGVGIIGSLSVSYCIKRFGTTRSFVFTAICWSTLPLGLLFAPNLWWLWLILSGWAQAANYVIMFSVITKWSKTQTEIRQLSSTTQVSAYLIAGIAPSVMGKVHDMASNWTIGLIVWSTLMVIMLITGWLTYRKVK